MVNLPPQSTTDRTANVLLDEEDERERVLLVGVGAGYTGFAAGSVPVGVGALHVKAATYALSVAEVREVIRARTTTRVPGSPPVMRGLVNVRGMVITVLDLAICLGYQLDQSGSHAGSVTEARAQMPGSIVLLEHGNRLVGLAVDSVREVRTLDEGGLVVQTGAEELRHGFVRGLASAGGEVVTLLDVAALVTRHLISGES